MSELTYHPILRCEYCGRETRHYFQRETIGRFQYVEESKAMTKEERERMESHAAMYNKNYRCVVCGNERVFGTRSISEAE